MYKKIIFIFSFFIFSPLLQAKDHHKIIHHSNVTEDFDSPQSISPYKKSTLTQLSILSPLGAHRFYVGKSFTGFLQFALIGIPVINKFFKVKISILNFNVMGIPVASIFGAGWVIKDLYDIYTNKFTDDKKRLVIKG